MSLERFADPKHLSVRFTADEYETIEKNAAASGQAVDDALYAALLIKVGATIQGFVSKNGLQNLVIEVNTETYADDVTDENLDALDNLLGNALLVDGDIDFTLLDAKTEITDLDEWEHTS
ncbi:MAG: hypothetical protein ABI835_22220 [Chloroflexota bacterium]